MEEINHVSHEEHPLMLVENAQMVVGSDDDGKREIVCSWCQEPILGATYACTSCDYFMHKACAQLEPIFNHYLHLQHPPLILSPYDEPWFCDVCGDADHVTGFIYKCSSCKFRACIKCCVVAERLKDATNVKVKIEGHPDHTLALQLRHAAFRCDACRTDDKDLLYQCNDCPFWIHKTCATLATNIHLPHHHHPLLLTYGLPERFYNFEYKCKFCKELIHGSRWLYHCANCRYFAHIKCALHAPLTPSPRDGLGATSNAEEQANDHDILHFPMSKAFNDPLKLLYLEKTTPDDDNATEIIHWSHHHPLMLNVKPQGNIMLDIDRGDPIIVCYGCVQPLTLPYYSCKDGCGFFLHKYCAELPRTLQHKLHKDHSLELVDFEDSKSTTYRCSGCRIYGNTFVYKCEPCNFYLDVNCAFLPSTIKHEFHKQHPLVQGINPKLRLCNACNLISDDISYLCEACDFQLDMYCALESPYSFAHRYCKGHEVPLTYPPVEDHIEDFYCTVCEEEMNPNFWLYHCNKCDNSFHRDCIGNIDWFGNWKVEGTVSVSYHKHPLTCVRRKKTPRYVCFGCNCDINGHLILECWTGTCPFRICIACHGKNRGRKHL